MRHCCLCEHVSDESALISRVFASLAMKELSYSYFIDHLGVLNTEYNVAHDLGHFIYAIIMLCMTMYDMVI